jgi:hypothetical protein
LHSQVLLTAFEVQYWWLCSLLPLIIAKVYNMVSHTLDMSDVVILIFLKLQSLLVLVNN